MPRPRNDELKERLARAACALFREQGYDATSYAGIAQACEVGKNLVQYHYPRKELFAIAFMEYVLEEAQTALDFTDDDLRADYGAVYQVGVCYFTYLLRPAGYRVFLQDVIRSRDLTESILAFNITWALQHSAADASLGAPGSEVVQGIVASMGGFYELLYYCLKNELPFDVAAELSKVMCVFMTSLGVAEAHAREIAAPKHIDPQVIAQAVQAMIKALEG